MKFVFMISSCFIPEDSSVMVSHELDIHIFEHPVGNAEKPFFTLNIL